MEIGFPRIKNTWIKKLFFMMQNYDKYQIANQINKNVKKTNRQTNLAIMKKKTAKNNLKK